MMRRSLSRGLTSGITVVLSGRGFLSSWKAESLTANHVLPGSPETPIPVKLQLLNHRTGGYSIRVIHNDPIKLLTSPIINEELSRITVLQLTDAEFDFILNMSGNRHVMSFSNREEGQQFGAILKAVNYQESMQMTTKRGTAAIAARFPGIHSEVGGRTTAPVRKASLKTDRKMVESSQAAVDNDIDTNTMVELLKSSIETGDEHNAVIWAKKLAKKRPKLSILVETTETILSQDDNISVKIQVEDRHSPKMKLRMSVPQNITIAGLKKQTLLKYDVPVQAQNWLVGGRIAKDSETLSSNGITSSGATLYLYLVTAEKANITKQDAEIEKHALYEERASQTQKPQRDHQRIYLTMNSVDHAKRVSVERMIPPSPLEKSHMRIPSPVNIVDSPPKKSNRISRTSEKMTVPSSLKLPDRINEKVLPSATDIGWECSRCTLVNPPVIPGCQACMMDRPEDYHPPDKGSYILDAAEQHYLQTLEENERAYKEMARKQQQQNYQDLLQMEGQVLVPNKNPFECPICLQVIGQGEGVVLRECLHTFCKDCLREHVKQSVDALVECPAMEDKICCKEHITEREVKALLNDEEFQKYLDRGLQRAESSASNSFHCKTADCKGFCFYEDDNNFFNCPLCKRMNCLTCKAIHEGIDCKQYQENLKIRAQNDVSAKQTQEALETLVRTGEAMHCPQCSVIVQKKGGCDWLRCSMCQVEICWVTKKARWGPAGSGDISGGCRCRVNGQKCHPNCHNCH